MTNLLRLLSLTMLLFYSPNYAQENNSFLHGKLVTRTGNLEGVTIANVIKNTQVLSDKQGYFMIECKVNDTLRFISTNYIDYTYVVNELDIKLNPILFPLEPLFTMNRLDEIYINKIDTDAMGLTNQYTKRYTPAERQLKKATTAPGGLGLTVPIDPIINYFTGRIGVLKKSIAYEKEDTRVEKLLELVSRDRLASYYKIPEDYVDSFVYYAVSKREIKEVLNAQVIDTRYLERYLTPIVFEFIEMINKETRSN